MLTNSTVYDLIYNSLQYLGVVSYGESIDPAISKSALTMLNAVRNEFSTNLLNYKPFDITYTTSANKQYITLGSSSTVSGDILVRPVELTDVYVLFGSTSASNSYKIPVKTFAEYRAQTIQHIFSLPQAAYIDIDYPLQRVYFYPGIGPGYSIRILGRSYLPEYENITDTLQDPPEYFNIYVLGLALRMSAMFGTDSNTLSNLHAMMSAASKHIKNKVFVSNMRRPRNDLGIAGSSINFFSGNSY